MGRRLENNVSAKDSAYTNPEVDWNDESPLPWVGFTRSGSLPGTDEPGQL